MRTAIILVLAAAWLWSLGPGAQAQSLKGFKPNRIDIRYVPPKNEKLKAVHDGARKAQILEKVQRLLSPLRLPQRLLFKTEDCDGVSNAWYEDESVTVCYEFLDDIWKAMPSETTPAGIAPVDTLAGPVVDVFLHEAGHAVFDLLKIPVLGREEDAADLFSIHIMLKFPKDEARRLIMGNAYQYKADMAAPTVTMAIKKFADEHGTPSQRFYNVLCQAYGADPKLFADFVGSGVLPKERAEGCEDEYQAAAYAFRRLVGPYVDRRLEKRLHRSWLPPVDKRPARRPDN